jgi:GNAT superfamily N-acetyltransferase
VAADPRRPPADLTIRQLDPAKQLDVLRPLWLALRDHHHELTPGWGPVRDDEASWGRRRKDYAAWLAEPDAFCLVAREGGPVAFGDPKAGPPLGYALVTVNPGGPTWVVERFGYLETLSVLPEARGRGDGRAQLDAVRARHAALGVHRLELTAVAANADARRFYEREGFAVGFVHLVADLPPRGGPAQAP